MRFPSPECYRYSGDDHVQWHHPLIKHYNNFDPLLIWTLLPNLTLLPIVWCFRRTFATGAAFQQRTLTPPDTWSCPTLGLACVLMSRSISPELVLLSDFWVSSIPRVLRTWRSVALHRKLKGCGCLTGKFMHIFSEEDTSNLLLIDRSTSTLYNSRQLMRSIHDHKDRVRYWLTCAVGEKLKKKVDRKIIVY